ncbi:esterase FE4-like [Bradysia coprophila]|uniref:esterase FE4-like n=1 Tax=Bradysia coprophila TaxID=38358 RepID=UPI00187DD194|nr:esterase FE4-like [Bradysia coprophila]
MKSKLNVFVYLIILYGCLTTSAGQIVQIEDGLIEGRQVLTRSGVSFNGFFGIPFAEPPIGELRFRAPVPKTPWDGVLNCTVFGPMCMQFGAGIFGSEDCLQLNVFTKNLPSNGTNERIPVLAFIHGGGFTSGTAMNHGPEYLMDRNIVLVTIQYRLGAFGFMALETQDIPGNQGLKDQNLALKWIQANIHHFGGDRDRVTISGLSAGSVSVTAHMVSPMSQGLFHNAIGLSGSIASQVRPSSNNIELVKEIATRVNCTVDTIDSMVNCLRNTSGDDIANNMDTTYFPCLIYPWSPWIVEPDFGQERFMIDDPSVLFREGSFSRVNVMAGITAHEFIWPAVLLHDPNATNYLNENWDRIAPTCFYFEGNEFTSAEEMATTLRESYFPFDVIDIRSFNNLNNLFADAIISYGVHKFVHLVNTFIDVYYYKFSYIGQLSFFHFPRYFPYGAHHGDDIQYFFNYGWEGIAIPLGHPDSDVVERMTRIWEQFAWTGNPNNSTDEYLEYMIWPKHDNAAEWYLDIGNHLVEKNGLYLERFTVWDSFDKNLTNHF